MKDSHYLKKELYGLIKTDESIFDFIQESALDGLWYWDLENPEEEWMNARFWTVLGYDPAEMPQKASAWQHIINAEDLKLATENLVKHCEDPDCPYDQTVRYTHKNGSTVWIRCRGLAKRDAHGKAVRMLGVHQDVTDYKNSELQLQKRTNLLRNAQKVARIGNWELDLKTNEVVWSEELYRMYGFDPTIPPPPYTEHSKLFESESWEQLSASLALTREQGIPYELELQTIRKEGSCGWMWVRGEAVKDESKEIIGLRGVAQDITERKNIENEKEALAKRLNYALDASGDGIWDWTPSNDITVYSKSWVEMLGYEMGEIASLASEWSDRLHPDDAEWVFETINKVAQSPENGDVFSHEYRFRNKAGDYLWIFNRGKVVERNENGEAARIVGTHTDITDRKQAEQHLIESETRFDVAIEGTEAGIWDWDMVNDTVSFSRRWKEMLGYEDAEIENSLEGWKKLWHPDDAAAIEKSVADHLNGITRKYEIVHRCRHKDGTWRWLMTRGKILRDETGKPHRWVGTNVDITPQKRAEEDEKIAREEAERANKAKSAFLATMSHEIRTPMNAVIGMTSLLLNSELSPEQREFAQTIRTSGDALLNLINDILDFSKIESEKINLEKKPFDLSDCIIEPLDILATKARERNIQLAYEIEASAPSTLVGDVARIKQILLNLLSNAVKFSEEGSDVALSVSCRSLPDEYYEMTCAIQDNGIGISEEAGKQLFKPFTQADSSITRRYGGTGLGLAISKRLTELMEGDLSFESQEGAGTTFYLKLPLRSGRIRKKIFERPDTHSLQGKKLLIVDDNEVNLRLFKAETEAWGMTARFAQNVTAALEEVSQFKPDLILTDYQMPDHSGRDLAERIRATPSTGRIPILLCSSNPLNKADMPENLFASILLKPLRQSMLYDALISASESGNKQAPQKRITRKNEINETLAQDYPLKILVAEDNPINQQVITSILGKMGYLADTAGDGQEAIESLKRQAYDLILMDIEMPRMNGLDATKRIRSTFPASRQPVIAALSANAIGEQQTTCLEHGMNAYLTKPVRMPELTELIKDSSSQRSGPTDSAASSKQSTDADTQSETEQLLDIEQLEMLSEAIDGDYPIEKLLSDHVALMDDDFNTLKNLISSGTPEQMRERLHRTHGGTTTLGMKALSEQIQNIREALKNTNTIPTAETIQTLETLFTNTLKAYKKANFVRQEFQY